MSKYTNYDLFEELKTDIIDYLKNYMDVSLLEKKFNNCKCVITGKRINSVLVGNVKKEVIVNDNGGFTCMEFYKNKDRIVIRKPIVFVSARAYSKEKQKQVAFHELMHVLSTRTKVIEGKRYNLKSGIYEQNVIYDNTILSLDNDFYYLNEAFTELVSKYIYDKIYCKKYKLKEKLGKCIYKSAYEKGYFILAFNLLNFFEKNPAILFDIYFNNNIKLLKKVLKENKKCDLEVLNSRVNESKSNKQKVMQGYKIYIDALNEIDPLNNKDVLRQYLL